MVVVDLWGELYWYDESKVFTEQFTSKTILLLLFFYFYVELDSVDYIFPEDWLSIVFKLSFSPKLCFYLLISSRSSIASLLLLDSIKPEIFTLKLLNEKGKNTWVSTNLFLDLSSEFIAFFDRVILSSTQHVVCFFYDYSLFLHTGLPLQAREGLSLQ